MNSIVSKNMEGTSDLSCLERNLSIVTEDKLSSLPWNVVDIILGKLSLQEAARTSILAKEWRYKWLSLSKFILNSVHIYSGCPHVNNSYLRWDIVSNIVNRFLIHHDGAIRTFVLKTYCSVHYPALYQWIQSLSKQDVEILTLEELGYPIFVVPSYLFMFEKLQSLNLNFCAIQIPPFFRRFRFLHELSLKNVSINDDDLHRLILGCPLLEKLVLLNMDLLRRVNINSPRLIELRIDLAMDDIVIGDPASLVSVFVLVNPIYRMIDYNWQRVLRCFSSLVALQNLVLCGSFIEILAAEACAFENFSWRNDSLSFLSLSNVDCRDVGSFRVCLSLLRSCPNIKKFKFEVDAAKGPRLVTSFLKENKGLVSFPALDSIEVKCPCETFVGCTVNFIEFICAHSPNLRFVRIAGWRHMERTLVSRMIKRFKKVCPRALVILHTTW